MRTKVTLILLLLNVALLAAILYARHEWRAERDLALVQKRVLGSEVVGIKSLEITAAGAEKVIRLERDKDTDPWSLKSPIDWPANDFAVRRIIHELEFLEHETSFRVTDLEKNGQSLSEYGLNPPKLNLVFTRASSTPSGADITTRLGIGDSSKVGNRRYLLSPDGKTVHIVGRSLSDSLAMGMDQLLSDTLFTIPVFEVRSLGLQNAAPAPRVRLRRDGARWSLEAPIVARAGKAPAEVVISGLNSLRVSRFVIAADAPDTRTGLDKPSLRITLEGNSRRETLLVGQPLAVTGPAPSAKKDAAAPATDYYARMEDRPQVFVTSIPDALADKLRRAQETLRDTKVLDFNSADVTEITLSAPGQPEPLTLRRQEAAVGVTAGWQIIGEAGSPALAADGERVGNLLQRLALLTVTPPRPNESGFLRDAPSDAEVEAYGFNRPERKITLTLASTITGPVPAPATKITLELGISGGSNGTVQARVAGQAFIYSVPGDTLDELPVAARLYRERVISTLPEGTQITGLKLVATEASATPVYEHQLAAGETWDTALAAEPEVRREALKALLVQLRTLRAKQFVSDTFKDTVLVNGQPTPWKYKLETTLSLGGGAPAQTTVHTLYFGERAGGGTQLAGLQDPAPGVVFEVDQGLLDAFWTLTYGGRDPGEPVLPAKPPAAP